MKKKTTFGSDLAALEAREVTQEELDEIPELTDEWFSRAKSYINGKPVTKEEADAWKIQWLRGHPEAAPKIAARIGRLPMDNPKTSVTLRFDPDIIEHFKADGPGWQTRINDARRRAARLPKNTP